MSTIVSKVLEITAACGITAGRVVEVVIAGIKFSADKIAERMSKKYDDKLERAMEKYKTELSKKEYVSQARFDAEFEIYKNLSRDMCKVVKSVNLLVPIGFTWVAGNDEAEKKKKEENVKELNSLISTAQDNLYSCMPFIPENFFNKYQKIMNLCRVQLDRGIYVYISTYSVDKQFGSKDYDRIESINNEWKNLNTEIREYLAKLDIL
ncbi:MAG: hypothetical protein IJ583_06560 [Firmicutes bacterium]|nr:hypothetical protein [Bacillota bacterium]